MSIQVRRMRRSDLKQLTQWGKHTDPRFYHYSFPYREPADLALWYRKKQKLLRRYIYAIDLNGRVIGFITLKKIKWLKRTGEMGITLDPNYMDKGYGTKAIVLYLYHVLCRLHLERVWLRTSVFNARAIRCYENVGFVETRRKAEPFEEQAFVGEIYGRYEHFEMRRKVLFTEYVYMEITQAVFREKYLSDEKGLHGRA